MRKLVTIVLGIALALGGASNSFAAKPMRFQAQLAGFNAAGQPVDTAATGHATVEVIDNGTALEFKVTVAGIDNLLMAHIHVAPTPVMLTDPAGPVAFWFTGGPPPGSVVSETVNGRLAQGYIITDGQIEETLTVDGTVAGLIAAIAEGRASVIVHTDDLDPNTPTGRAGDSRAGELRGTLE